MKFFRIWTLAIGVALVSGFTATAVYWLWLTLSDQRVYARGGIYFVLGALAMALGSYLAFRAFLRWASGRGYS